MPRIAQYDTPWGYPSQGSRPAAAVRASGYTQPSMDPQDRLQSVLDGIACSVCEASVKGDRIRLLARREDLAFVEIACPGCGCTTLGFVVDADSADAAPPAASPVTADDVLDMHVALEAWHGDLRSLLADSPAPDSGHSGRPR